MRPKPLELPRVCSSMSSSVSISMTSEYGFSTRRVFGRIVSRSADSDRRPEKIITGISGRRRHHDFAAGAAAQPQIDDGGGRTMRLDRVESFISGFRGHHGVLPHLQKLDERLAHGAVVFDDENDQRCFSNHVGIIVLTGA